MYLRLLLTALVSCLCLQAASQPNVIIILADDMGRDSVGAFNDKLGLPTPYLDKLAAEGMSFPKGTYVVDILQGEVVLGTSDLVLR